MLEFPNPTCKMYELCIIYAHAVLYMQRAILSRGFRCCDPGATRLLWRGKQCVCSCSPVCGGGGGGGTGGGAGVGSLTPEEAPGSRPPSQRTLWCVASRATVADELCALPHTVSPLCGAPAAPVPPQTHLHQAGVLGGGRVVGDVHNL